MRKKVLLVIGAVIFGASVYYHDLLLYGFRQARGQAEILLNTRPINEVLTDATLSDSLKSKLRLIAEIKRFAIDSLGLDDSDSYTQFYDQHGKPILWVVTAAERHRMVAKEWDFPIIGTFAYKGFFDSTLVQAEEKTLIAQGFDTQINEVSAWSTLGFLDDPVLSSMLYRAEGSLANLIMHEMTHGTIFVKNNLELNENLASFVGDYGAIRFLESKYGKTSPQLRRYEFQKQYNHAFGQHVLIGAKNLDSLYKSFHNALTATQKDTLKAQMIRKIIEDSDTLLGGIVGKKYPWRSKKLPNNAFFIGYLTYRSQQNMFAEEFKNQFKNDFKSYFAYLKTKYKSSF